MPDRTVQDLFSLRGRTALVTGATGHLGGAMATALAEAGARVVVTSRNIDDARGVADALPGEGHAGVALDHLDERSIAAAIDAAGPVDVLVANAHEPLGKDLTTVTADEFDRQLRNATGYFTLARHVRDRAVARAAPASIVLLGSMYGVVGSYPDVYAAGAANPVAYQTLKGGIVQMTRHLAVYWARDNVRVNCLSPGPFPQHAASKSLVERLEQRVPMQRVGRPEELKGAVVFLASDASSFVTGQNLLVDGGWTAW